MAQITQRAAMELSTQECLSIVLLNNWQAHLCCRCPWLGYCFNIVTAYMKWGVTLQEKAEQGLRGRPLRLPDSLAHLDAMGSALAAARAFCDAECGFAAAAAARTAIRLGQQAQSPPR